MSDDISEKVVIEFKDLIVGQNKRGVKGVLGTWRYIEKIIDPYYRVYYRKHFLVALKQLGMSLLNDDLH